MQANPYVELRDNFLASALSFLMLVFFVACIMFKMATLTELEEVRKRMSEEQRADFHLPSLALSAILLVAVLGALGMSFVMMLAQTVREQARMRHEALVNKARRLRFKADDREVDLAKLAASDFHLFLSHVWSSGQDQMRVIKARLCEMMPACQIFLDVDDLKEIGNLQQYIERSLLILASTMLARVITQAAGFGLVVSA